MGYFTTGTEGELYEARYCSMCAHDCVAKCTIMQAHWVAAATRDSGWADDDSPTRMVLDMFIPRDNEGNNMPCTMLAMEEITVISELSEPGAEACEGRKP